MKWLLVCVLAIACTVSAKEELTASKIMMEVYQLQHMGKKAGVIDFLDQLYNDIASESATADEAFNTFMTDNCDYVPASNRIQELKDLITQKNQQVLSKTWSMGNISETDIPPLRGDVEDFHDPINQKEEELAGLKQTRDENHKMFIERRTETLRAIKVVEEIRLFLVNASEVSAHASGTGDGGFVKQDYGALLETAARQFRGMKGQLMRTAARALTSGAVDSIDEILYKMRNEFKDQLDSLGELERTQYQSWHSARVRLRNEIGQLLIDMETKKQEISGEHTKMAALEAEIAVLNIEMANHRYELNAEQMGLEDRHKLCTEEQERYLASKARREEALSTLDTLKAMLETEMAKPEYARLKESLGGNTTSVETHMQSWNLTDDEIVASGVGSVQHSLQDLQEATPEARKSLSSSWSHGDEKAVSGDPSGVDTSAAQNAGGGVPPAGDAPAPAPAGSASASTSRGSFGGSAPAPAPQFF